MTKRVIRDWARNVPPLPASPPESPEDGDSGGEEVKFAETRTQGGARGSCPSLALGYKSVARTGLSEEPAASRRWTCPKTSNLQPLSIGESVANEGGRGGLQRLTTKN
jgi:hypothetical protein